MKGEILSRLTPQAKMVAVNKKFGNTNIKSQQGTTRTIFDSLPLDGRTNFRFFENANTRQFPLTNIGSEGNRLNVGETFTIQKIYLNLVTYDAGNNTVTATSTFVAGASDFYNTFGTGELDFIIANSQVIKQLPSTFILGPGFNPTAANTNDHSFGLSTDIVIPPLLEYLASLKTTSYDLTGITFTHVQLYLQGTAGILAPQSTF